MSSRWNVLVLDPIHPAGIARLKEQADVYLAYEDEGATKPEALARYDAVIVRTSPVERDFLLASTRLKVVGKHGVGYDNIHLETLSAMGAQLVWAPWAGAESVAEHALALMLAVARRIPQSDLAVRQGKFSIRNDMLTRELSGKTVGIIGAGRIGRTFAEKCAHALHMRVLAYDPYLSAEDAAAANLELTDLDTLLRTADVVSIHAPLTSETYHLIGERELSLMKPEAILINTSRGPLVDEQALIKCLQAGKIAGAGLDVFETEPPAPDNLLLSLDNVVLSPHHGGATLEAMERTALMVVEDVFAVLQGKEPKHRVQLPPRPGTKEGA